MSTEDLKHYIPSIVQCQNRTYPISLLEEDDQYVATYTTEVSNSTRRIVGDREYKRSFPKRIMLNEKNLEVIGLLQGEMSKKYRRYLTFANSEPQIVNKVMIWFSEELQISSYDWKWYIRLNIPEPKDEIEKLYFYQELMNYWMTYCPLNYYLQNRTLVSFVKVSKHKEPQNKGTLMIERGEPLFIQTVQKVVHDITYSMPDRSAEEIIPFMLGIIAAEGCVDFQLKDGHRRVFITATVEEERNVFRMCLQKLGIETQDCKPIKDIIISRRKNILKLHELNLMTGSPEKHEKFLKLIDSYS